MNVSFATTPSPDQASKMNVSLVTSQEIMRTAEVKKLLQVSEKKVAQLRSSGDLPFTKVHGMLYYKTSDVEALFNPKN
jgi:hypothetical protein